MAEQNVWYFADDISKLIFSFCFVVGFLIFPIENFTIIAHVGPTLGLWHWALEYSIELEIIYYVFSWSIYIENAHGTHYVHDK